MITSTLQSLLTEAKALEKQGFTSPELRMACRSAKDALRHAAVGQDVEKLTEALLGKAQEMARLGQLTDYAAARRRLAIARASIWTPDQTTEAMESAAKALGDAVATLKARHGIRHAMPVKA